MKLIYSLTHTMPLLGGVASLTIKEHEFKLSEKSLYGAGTIRHSSHVRLTFSVNGEELEISNSSNQERQHVIDFDIVHSFASDEWGLVVEDLCNQYINRMMISHIFSAEE